MAADSQVLNTRAHVKERIGQLIVFAGKEAEHVARVRPGRHRRGRQAQGDARRRLAGRARGADRDAAHRAAGAGDGVRGRAEEQGRGGQGLRLAAAPAGGGPDDRPAPRPADRRADRRRALAGPRRSDRRPSARPLRRRGDAASRRACPTRRRSAERPARTGDTRSRPADAASSATATSRSSRWRRARSFEFVDQIKGGVIPHSFIPGVEKGVLEAMQAGALAGYPVKDVRVRLVDGSYHSVDSSEIAFKLAGAQAMQPGARASRAGAARADHARDAVGAGGPRGRRDRRPQRRRGRPQGMEPVGAMTRDQGRGADGGDAHLRARPALDHRGPGRLHAGVPALRGASRRTSRRSSSSVDDERVAASLSAPPAGGWRIASAVRSGRQLLWWADGHPTIVTSQPDVACDVCERRLLRGEQPDVFLDGRPAPHGLRAVRPARRARGLAARGRQQLLVDPARRCTCRGRGLLGTACASTPRRQARRSRRDGRRTTTSGASSRPAELGPATPSRARARRSCRGVPRRDERRAFGRSRLSGRAGASLTQRDRRCSTRASTPARRGRRAFARRARGDRPPGDAVAVERGAIVVAWELCWYSLRGRSRRRGRRLAAIAQGTELDELPARIGWPTRRRRARRARADLPRPGASWRARLQV